MKNLYVIILFLFPFLLQSQITLTADDLPQAGDVLTSVDCEIPVGFSIGSPGANQTYDFSNLTPIDTTANNFISPSGTPGQSEFPNATLVGELGGDYVYYQQTSSALYLLGSYTDTSNNGIGQYAIIHYNPTNKVFEIPSTYNTSFTDMSGFTSTMADNSGSYDSIRTTFTTNDDVLFDGYGTVITPDGSFDGLRERTITTTNTNLEVYSMGAWSVLYNYSETDTSYNWYGNNNIGLASVIIFDGEIIDISYSISNAQVSTPIANFTSDDLGGGTISFEDISNNVPTSWLWDFGDGSTSVQQSPDHTFAASGTYNVCLTATNSAGSNTFCMNVVISIGTAPVTTFTASTPTNGTVVFTDGSSNAPTSWFWDFGDGNTSTEQNPTHTYMASGTYNVCLTATNSVGSNTTCMDIVISIGTAPVATFTVSTPTNGTVVFTDASTNIPTSWLWDFGDGNTSTEQNPTHTYTASGTYNVCLTATNSVGSNTTCMDIVISIGTAPVATFTVSTPTNGTVVFTDASTNIPTSWLWDFGDGNTSTEQNPTHTYTASGTYNVCLTATNSVGSNTTCMDVIITLEIIPVSAFTFSTPTNGTVVFTDASTNIPTSWLWDFGDGNTSTEQNPTHTYTASNMYTGCLTASNAAGSNMVCETINITITATNDLVNPVKVEIFPNPTSEILNIKLENPNQESLHFQLINSIGQRVIFRNVESNGSYQINMKNLGMGMYYYNFLDSDGVIRNRGKVVKK